MDFEGINILIADCAISFAEKDWILNNKIATYYKKRKRLPLRDASKHQHLLANIPQKDQLARPDILHSVLLLLLGYAKFRKMNIYFSTIYGTYCINSKTNIPKSQERFYGILEKLFLGNSNSELIYKIKEHEVISLMNRQKILLSSNSTEKIQNIDTSFLYVFGGFSHGNFITKFTEYQFKYLVKGSLELLTAVSLFLNLNYV